MQEPLAIHASNLLILISVLLAIYFAFLATLLARLWYYSGDLGPQPKRYIILPRYLRNSLSTPLPNKLPPPASPLENPFADPIDTPSAEATHDANLEPDRWTNIPSHLTLDLTTSPSSLTLPGIRALLKEQNRISRLPHFQQDDCGDGSEFPDVPVVDPTNPEDPVLKKWRRGEDVRYQADVLGEIERGVRRKTEVVKKEGSDEVYKKSGFRNSPSTGNYMTMGLRKLDLHREWLVVEDTAAYAALMSARATLLPRKRAEVIVVEREAEEACEELLNSVFTFLTTRYPNFFEILEKYAGVKVIRNKKTNEEYRIHKPWSCHPLELCARLACEDFNVLAKSEFTGEHRLIASATLFPAGWRLRSRIGKSITDLHGPVPLWNGKLSHPVEHYFTRLSSSSCMQRSSFFIQINPDNRPLDDLLFIQSGKDFFPGDMRNLAPECVVVRSERQTFQRLEKSGAVVFTVKTSVERLVDLARDQREKLAREIRSWPDEIAEYKGRDLWSSTVLGFCEGAKARVEDVDILSD
ncbi:hypothetical protein M011DRAFT_475597 [Sporormia fimetaria CBS 119925]|uniref:Uncharacterized protein n=1 Tax=Sporormia fimetaria CBS 119925 TaxID=1340428 RepID=A0A6A6VG26_9PLEO|nr:hypothetical protein M011DRAFT_475597 [Sporormia fimetaria CBS 119925]